VECLASFCFATRRATALSYLALVDSADFPDSDQCKLGLFIRYNVVIPAIAEFGVYFVKLKWITVPVAAIYLMMRHEYLLTVITLFWPWLAGILGCFPPGLVGKTQKMFMARFGYAYDHFSGSDETAEQKLAQLEAENAKLRNNLIR